MADPPSAPTYDTAFDPQTGVPVAVAQGLVRVTAPNRGPYTFTGTNSFIVGGESIGVVDPGPNDDAHFEALMAAIGGRRVEAILLTHTHKDHSSLAKRLQQATKAPLWFGGQHRTSRPRRFLEINAVAADSDWDLVPDRMLTDGQRIEVGGASLEVIATPGHCANHLCFGFPGTDDLLSGDHVMGWSSTLVPVPDGSMTDYLASLEKMIALPYRRYLPAHGGPIADGPAYASTLLRHRLARNEQIVAAVGRGARYRRDLLRMIYPGLALPLVPAALMTLKAHIEYLEAAGRIAVARGLFGTRLFPA